MADDDFIEIERNGSIGTLWLNRPDVLNALSDPMMAAVTAGVRALDNIQDINVIVIRGRGRAFCSGADRNGFTNRDRATTEMVRSSLEVGAGMINTIMDARAIVISAIHGYCVGGGVSIGLASDIAVATIDTKFFVPEVDLGLPYLWGSTALLIAAIGLKKANYYALTCDHFDASQALEMGIINEACKPDKLDKIVGVLAEKLASKPPAGLLAQKRLTNRLIRYLMTRTGDETALGVECIHQVFPHIGSDV